jgi:hypothetical protein
MALKLGSTTASLYLGITPVAAYLGTEQVYSAAGGTPATLLLNFNGSNGSTTFTDSSANGYTVTANGDAQISTAQSKFGGSSLYLDGTGDSVEIPSAATIDGTEDFTIECWIRPAFINPTPEGYSMVLGFANDLSGAFMFGLRTGGHVFVGRAWVAIDGETGSTAGGPLSIDTWHHIAVTRASGTLRVFVDGAEKLSQADTFSYVQATGYIGRDIDSTNPAVEGYIDDFRIIRGAAIYTAAFTPPTSELGPTA